jgi:hypothetical protein
MPITAARLEGRPEFQHDRSARRDFELPGRDPQFIALQEAYRSRGGLVSGESLARRMSAAGTGGYVDLARRIVGGQVFSFQWHQDFWLPLFQFHPEDFTPLEAPRRVTRLLRDVLDGWAVARWYVTPSQALDGRSPLALLDADLPAVLAAAQAQRQARCP